MSTSTLKTLSCLGAIVLTSACGLVQLNGKGTDSAGPSSNAQSSSPESSTNGANLDSSRTALKAASQDDNKKYARLLKEQLRGENADWNYNKGEEAFARVEKLCGTKIWDRCAVVELSEANEYGDKPIVVQIRNTEGSPEGTVFQFPEMLLDISVPAWTDTLHEYFSKNAHGPELLAMLHEKCGSPVTTKCQLRGMSHQVAILKLTVKVDDALTADVILIPQTINDWARDL